MSFSGRAILGETRENLRRQLIEFSFSVDERDFNSVATVPNADDPTYANSVKFG